MGSLLETRLWRSGIQRQTQRTLGNELESDFQPHHTRRAEIYSRLSRDSYDVVFEWTNDLNLSERDQLTFGALYDRIRGAENFHFAGTTRLFPWHPPRRGFLRPSRPQASDNLKVIGGFQANKIGSLAFMSFPAGASSGSPPPYAVKALYSEAFRAPSINETEMDYVPPAVIGGPSLIGNPNLMPEHVATSDLELLYGNNRIEAEVNYFRVRIGVPRAALFRLQRESRRRGRIGSASPGGGSGDTRPC